MPTTLRLVIFTALVSTACVNCAGDSSSENDTSEPQPTISGGEEDVSGFYTFVVEVGGGCSGTLITDRHVLTAAHCVCPTVNVDPPQNGVSSRRSAANCNNVTSIELHAPNLDDLEITGTVTPHPSFFMDFGDNEGIIAQEADLALIELNNPAPLTYGFVSITDQQASTGAGVTIVGYGRHMCEAPSDRIRRYGTNEIAGYTPDQDRIRILESEGALNWKGDSGGPMFANVGNALRVVGVSSAATCNDEADTDIGLYTNVSLYSDWVNAAVVSSQNACGNLTCDPGETPSECCTDCGCPGGQICQQNECNPSPLCTPNSTCCEANGTPTALGDNGSNCLDECSQCNGGGACVPRPPQQPCADGAGTCDGLGGCNVATCGDGANTIDPGEQCDGNNLGGSTCTSQGYDGGTLNCSDNCTLDTSQCTLETCGDDGIDLGEECDGNNFAGATCINLGFDGGVLNCLSNCTIDTSQCTVENCGNGTIDLGEQCDGGNLNGATCQSLGYGGGNLSCHVDCSYNVNNCTEAVIDSDPNTGVWTPSFTPNMNGPCEPGNEDYHTLYRGRVNTINTNGNVTTMQFKKFDDSNPSTNISYWVVVGDATPSCLDLNSYVVRKAGTWLSANAVLTVSDVNIWPNVNAYEQAACGEDKYLFVITGGGGGNENQKIWFQKKSIRFTKSCG